MEELVKKIEAILFYKNDPVGMKELSKILEESESDINKALSTLGEQYKNKGVVLVNDGEKYVFGTNPELSNLIEDMRKEELSRELGRAGLETLAVVLYKGAVARREIDYIRGVNSGSMLRNLMIRGLVERESISSRGYIYKPTLKLIEHLGIKSIEELPQYKEHKNELEDFTKRETEEDGD